MKQTWSASEIIKLYKIDRTKTSLYRDEADGTIPKAFRVKRGSSFARVWDYNSLIEIGKSYGFLQKPNETKVISVYSPKGGVLKSTFAFNIARVLALNGISVLVIGLDVQGTITRNLKLEENEDYDDVTQIQEIRGLYESCKSIKNSGCKIEDTVLNTDLPNLKYIPESSSLVLLEQKIRDEQKREFFLDRLIKPLKPLFDVIIFDNSPNWNFLIQNSLVAATDVICPVACDIETFRSLAQNIQMIDEFKTAMELDWKNFVLIATKLERNRLSTQIEAKYKTMFPEYITASSIRATTKGQESSLNKVSAIEFDSSSTIAEDYYSVIQDIWERINPKKQSFSNRKVRNKKQYADECA